MRQLNLFNFCVILRNMHISVIIPAYNEEKRIEKTLWSIDRYLSGQSYDYEILVVDDGSRDATVEVVRGLVSQIKGLRLISNKENRGKGWVVRQGMLEAAGKYRLFMDADNSTTVDQIAGFFPYFQKGYDVVIGSRRIKDANIVVKQTFLRDFLGGVFRFAVHTLVPLNVADSQAGFKMFSKKATAAVFPRQTICRWAFDVEIISISRKLGLKIKEAPIKWANSAESHVKVSGMCKMLLEVFIVRLKLWTGKYK